MEKYESDLYEIREILRCVNSQAAFDITDCNSVISRMTEITGEGYLDDRASAIRSRLSSGSEVMCGLYEIHVSCCKELKCSVCPVSKYCNSNINRLRSTCNPEAPVMIDLFCGAGGLSLGFTQEGFVTSLANDIEPCCIDTYAHNHPEIPRKHIVLGDIKNVVENIGNFLRFPDVDVIVGGPPCQGFSMANRQRLIDDPRNHLYKEYVHAVSIVRPRFFVMENVKGMLPVAPQVVEDFRNIGYSVSYRVINARNFGVPQNRERLIYIGNCEGFDNNRIFDRLDALSSEIQRHVLSDALSGLRSLNASRQRNETETGSEESGRKIEKAIVCENNDYIRLINQGRECPVTFNHKARFNNDRDIEIFSRLNPGDRSDDPKIADIMPYARRNGIFKDKYFKLEPDKVCKTITAHMKFDCNMYIHPTEARGLTPREAARIQSYPDDYYFRGPYTKTYMQIGNSVPPLLGRAIASVLKEIIEGK